MRLARLSTVDFCARSVLGPDLQIVVLHMTLEEQKDRIRARHGGSQDAVNIMKVRGREVRI